jgi:predicted GNAT family acetyltransferase
MSDAAAQHEHEHDPQVRLDEDRHRYELWLGDELAGHLRYRPDEAGRRVFVHTEVDEGHQGEGLAAVLVEQALAQERSAGGRVVAECPYVRKFVHEHPEWRDVVEGEVGPSNP